jgi:hypothetical protein
MRTQGLPSLVEKLKSGCLAPELLELKLGAVVMFVKNNFKESYMYNWLQVDEVQDLNPLQWAIINKITDKNLSHRVFFGDYEQSIFSFMEFDKIEDNMIVQKNGKRYLMVVECQGINYDLMSRVEKVAVEEGFQQFLNTLRHPVQIYTQTRTINLENSIQTYRAKVQEIEAELEKEKRKYQQMVNSDNYSEDELKAAFFELTKTTNLYEYGKDIIYNRKDEFK